MDNTAIAGFTIGGEFEYQISKHFSLAAGLGYSLQGSGLGGLQVQGRVTRSTRSRT
jgi:hypothetical protein